VQLNDAQVIFETLNARGEPLLPADLLRNFIFVPRGKMKISKRSTRSTGRILMMTSGGIKLNKDGY
jgi:uncharacterized protein with ParB-like and HNH nuclease domain